VESEPRTAYGAWEPEPDKSISHSDGFEKAMELALKDAGKWGPGSYGAVVECGARIDVKNPGSIGEYRIKLTEN